MSDLHRIPESYIPVSPRQPKCPAAADSPKGSGEVLERDRGFANPLSLSNRPREESIKSTHTMWYSPLVKPEKRNKYNAAYHISPAGNQ